MMNTLFRLVKSACRDEKCRAQLRAELDAYYARRYGLTRPNQTVIYLAQPMLSDYGLYKCTACGQIVLGLGKDEHVKTVHGGERQGFEES